MAELLSRQLKTFLMLADELSFVRTAESLGLTGSRVSQIIRALEAQLGRELFERSSRSVELTRFGEELAAALRGPFGQIERTLELAVAGTDEIDGTLTLGMYPVNNGGSRMVEIIRAFEVAHPACEVQIVESGWGLPTALWLRQGKIDLLAMREPLQFADDLVVGPELTRERRVVLVGADHPLAGRDSVVYDDLADYRVTGYGNFSRALVDALIPPVTSSGRMLKRLEVPGGHTVMDLWSAIAANRLVHPTVPSLIERYPMPGVVAVPIEDLPPSRTALVWVRGRRSPAARAFVETAERTLGSV